MSATIDDSEVYGLIGEEGFARLTGAFYRRVAVDDILGPLYPREDLSGAEMRLNEFLVQRFGGPPRYSQSRGHPRLRMRHAPYAIDLAARDRWVQLMGQAMEEADLPPEVVPVLRKYFEESATFMINRPG